TDSTIGSRDACAGRVGTISDYINAKIEARVDGRRAKCVGISRRGSEGINDVWTRPGKTTSCAGINVVGSSGSRRVIEKWKRCDRGRSRARFTSGESASWMRGRYKCGLVQVG